MKNNNYTGTKYRVSSLRCEIEKRDNEFTKVGLVIVYKGCKIDLNVDISPIYVSDVDQVNGFRFLFKL